MLIEFIVGNYKSYKNKATFSMVASNLKDLKENTFVVEQDLRLLKSAVIYGANASGKSNLFEALGFMKAYILQISAKSQSNVPIPVNNFRLDSKSVVKPSFFEVTFVNEAKHKYIYGFEVSREKVNEEWLHYYPKNRKVTLFTRTNKTIVLGPRMQNAKELTERTNPNALFLSVADQWGNEFAKEVINWFSKLAVASGVFSQDYKIFSMQFSRNNKLSPKTLDFVRNADPSISSYITKETDIHDEVAYKTAPEKIRELLWPEGQNHRHIRTSTFHKNDKGEEVEFDLSEESAGTQQMFDLHGPIIDSLQNGRTLLIDELETHLHPRMLMFIVDLFHDSKINRKNAQLIFSTHNTTLLGKGELGTNILRRDQVWFTEKDRENSTNLFSLVEYRLEKNQKVRHDASYEKDYLLGKYGATPVNLEFDN